MPFNIYIWIQTIYLIIAFGILILIVVPCIVIYMKNFSYEIDEKFIIVRSGILTRSKATIPFSRIQNVAVKQGIFDRLTNLYTVKIETAGAAGASAQSNGLKPEGYIPGVRNPERIEEIINKLVNKYTQNVPDGLQGYIYESNDLAFDEFIAMIISKMVEGKNLKTKIKKFREKENWTQSELAEKVGVSRQTISYLENGRYVPSLALAMKIARLFKLKIEELFELDDQDMS